MDCSDFPALRDKSAACYRDLMGKSRRLSRRKGSRRESESCRGESPAHSCAESPAYSDSSESSTSSSSSSSTAFKDWNAIRDVAGTRSLKASSYGAGFLCGLVLQRRGHLRPRDQNVDVFSGPEDE